MSARLHNAVALVTGAGSGNGGATALSLAAEGAAVEVVARRRHRLEELAGKIRAEGGTALAVGADITEQEQATAAVARVVAEPGRLDVLDQQLAGMEMLRPEDIVDTVCYVVTRDRRVSVNEVLVRASEQTW
ncbi:SDR family NAD(P)-dependent oxidoreductase [Streptomyces chiangmaiensis]|uniref:SDR family NAD(P)-dependent oxidoreductase n=1 Tax=Streptomyces chiangmaiensis TaxID=766497 RepID=A0ABU7FAH5_9ACTN|nr:SDR family NAD(P)-dependent oxidoreductase [Streptomyces chiangmaiensis]MED7821186.1 SDR family NAD(P)-dependent oxidoreductase [Streptomyces chiangmaiensis]